MTEGSSQGGGITRRQAPPPRPFPPELLAHPEDKDMQMHPPQKNGQPNSSPALVAGAAGGGAVAVALAPSAVAMYGFTGAGILAGSPAAAMMSTAAAANGGCVASFSLVAGLQSVGAVGLATSTAAGMVVLGAVAVGGAGLGAGAVLARRKFMEYKDRLRRARWDVTTMSIKAMKEELSSLGGSAEGCVERADIVARLLEARGLAESSELPAGSPSSSCGGDAGRFLPADYSLSACSSAATECNPVHEALPLEDLDPDSTETAVLVPPVQRKRYPTLNMDGTAPMPSAPARGELVYDEQEQQVPQASPASAAAASRCIVRRIVQCDMGSCGRVSGNGPNQCARLGTSGYGPMRGACCDCTQRFLCVDWDWGFLELDDLGHAATENKKPQAHPVKKHNRGWDFDACDACKNRQQEQQAPQAPPASAAAASAGVASNEAARLIKDATARAEQITADAQANDVRSWGVEQVLAFFERCKFPTEGVQSGEVDGESLVNLYQDPDAESIFTAPAPDGLGFNKLMFKGRFKKEMEKLVAKP